LELIKTILINILQIYTREICVRSDQNILSNIQGISCFLSHYFLMINSSANLKLIFPIKGFERDYYLYNTHIYYYIFIIYIIASNKNYIFKNQLIILKNYTIKVRDSL